MIVGYPPGIDRVLLNRDSSSVDPTLLVFILYPMESAYCDSSVFSVNTNYTSLGCVHSILFESHNAVSNSILSFASTTSNPSERE